MNIAEILMDHTAKQSGFETSRKYLSLSHAVKTVDELVADYFNGYKDDLLTRLKCYKGYQMERDMVARVVACFPGNVTVNHEVTAHNRLVQGHIEFLFDGYPADVKSVPLDAHMPNGKVSRRVLYQLHGYMHYMQREKALVVYESRESGLIWTRWIPYIDKIGREVEAKYTQAVEIVKSKQVSLEPILK